MLFTTTHNIMMFHSIINIFIFYKYLYYCFIMPDVKPTDEIKYDFKQSKHEVVPKLPMRAMLVGAVRLWKEHPTCINDT